MTPPASVVLKFGGTSVQDRGAIARLVDIVSDERRPRVVVVSALAGVTDRLSTLVDSEARAPQVLAVASDVRARYLALAREVVAPARLGVLARHLHDAFAVIGERVAPPFAGWTPRFRDEVLAVGELASSRLVTEALRSAGLPAVWIDAREVVITDEAHGAARPDSDAIARAAGRRLAPLLEAGSVAVLGGYVGATPRGVTTTLGRGGSDYSAALVAAAVHARELQIWTDVNGVHTADPRVVPGTARIERLSFDEAYELARFGAKVLHWGTLEPAAAHAIAVRVLDARRPLAEGTTIAPSSRTRGPVVTGLARQSRVAVGDLRARGVTGSKRFLETVLAWLDRHGARVSVIALSPVRAVVSSPDPRLVEDLAALVAEDAVSDVSREASLVAVVGDNVAAHPVAWRTLGAASEEGDATQVVPAQSGHALVAITAESRGAALLARLHDQLLVGPALGLHRESGLVAGARS